MLVYSLAFDFCQPGSQQFLKTHERLGKPLDAFRQLVIRHAVSGVHRLKDALVHLDLLDRHRLCLFGIEFSLKLSLLLIQLREKFWSNC